MDETARRGLIERLDADVLPHRAPLRQQALRAPGRLVRRLALVRLAQLASRLNISRSSSARMFYGETLRFPFPACWDLQVYGTYIDEAELRLIKYLLRAVPTGGEFVDVGANVGLMCQLAARLVGQSGRVFAFEPGEQALAFCRANVSRFAQVRLVPEAAMEEPGQITFFEGTGAGMVSSSTVAQHLEDRARGVREVTIRATTLDAFCAKEGAVPDIVKIDVEGAELSVLKGAPRLLAETRPAVVLEVSFAPEEYESLYAAPIAHLRDAGYVPHALGADGYATPLGSKDLREHGAGCTQARGYLHMLDNILFLHPDGRGAIPGSG